MNDRADALLSSSGLPERWRGRERFVLLQVPFDDVLCFHAAWRAWREDPQRCDRLHFVAIGSMPAMRAALLPASIGTDDRDETIDRREGNVVRRAESEVIEHGEDGPFQGRGRNVEHAGQCDSAAPCPDHGRAFEAEWSAPRGAAWPPLTPNPHRLSFENGRVQLLLAPGEPADVLRDIVAGVDAFLLGRGANGADLLGPFPRSAKSLARIASPSATLVVEHPDEPTIATLRGAGFEPVSARHPEATRFATFHYAPHFAPRAPCGRRAAVTEGPRHAVIVGGGLAGCATAWALAEHGWTSTVLERQASIAAEGSGNRAGLFHGIVNRQDGTHARFHRAAALEASAAVSVALARHGVAGAVSGLLQLCDEADASPVTMRSALDRLKLDAGYVRAVDASEASEMAGVRLERPGWFYPGAGWVHPAGLARSFLERAGDAARVRCRQEAARLHRDGEAWQVIGHDGRVIETARTVVLANAGDAPRLLGMHWPVQPVRGQISIWPARGTGPLPRLPISGAGYALSTADGLLLFGATSDPDDHDPGVRPSDHARNLAQLRRLAPALADRVDGEMSVLQGRTAWRWTSRDRLPLIGPVPLAGGMEAMPGAGRRSRTDQPRFVAREPGLFVYTALGSRGITWSALGAQVLAAAITGAPSPVEASLLDALDPVRFMVRESRRPGRRTGLDADAIATPKARSY